MALYANKKGHRISVFTTLVGMKVSDVAQLEHIPFGFFRVHLPTERGLETINTDENYLPVLDRLLSSKIKAKYHGHGGSIRPQIRKQIEKSNENVELRSLYSRSGNFKAEKRLQRKKKRGAIRCVRKLRNNVLLPNGDVVLCSNDYGMKHVLGNLLSENYESLFNSPELLLIEKGQRDESLDILCRHCDNFCRNADWVARVHNFKYEIDRYLYYIRDIRDIVDLNQVVKKAVGNITSLRKT
jgi:radical SAM protein with 4Fe4S-binding SPASM domain